MNMEERSSLLPGREQHDQNGAAPQKIHLFVTPTEVTFLTEEEYKTRTQPDGQGIQRTSSESDQERISRRKTQPLASGPIVRASKTWLIAPVMALLMNVGIVLAIFFLDVLPILTQQVTVTIIPKSQHISTTATLDTIQSRLLPTLTLSKTKTVNATGKRHQDAEHALGTITFYNGLFSSQEVPAGTLLTGSDGVQIVTDQAASIPPASPTTPPTYGNTTVQAHAVQAGAQGNIATRDINYGCCGTSILAQNTVSFQGGQDERNYMVVTKDDVHTAVSSLTPFVTQRLHIALTSQLTPGERLLSPSCASEGATDHQIGEEAETVTVTLAAHCKGIAFTNASLQQEAQKTAAAKVQKTLGVG